MQDYSIKVYQLNADADYTKLGVQLGRLCISLGLPVATVAKELDVSKSVVYSWFTGRHDVGKHLRNKVEMYYRALPPPDRRPPLEALNPPA